MLPQIVVVWGARFGHTGDGFVDRVIHSCLILLHAFSVLSALFSLFSALHTPSFLPLSLTRFLYLGLDIPLHFRD